MEQVPEPFLVWVEKTKVASKSANGKVEAHTVAEFWRQHVEKIRQGAVKKSEQKKTVGQADQGRDE